MPYEISLLNRVFRRLTAVERLPQSVTGETIRWRCLCSCGQFVNVAGNLLRSGSAVSCGCHKRDKYEEKFLGRIFGRLTPIKIHHRDKGSVYWECSCSCGAFVAVTGSSLRKGNTKSCGCIRSENSTKNIVWHAYVHRAARLRLGFSLSKEDAFRIMIMPCSYCGAEPSNRRALTDRRFDFVYNGLDRVDNRKGYQLDNVVPCCKWCNMAKRERSGNEFKQWLIAAYSHMDHWPVFPEVPPLVSQMDKPLSPGVSRRRLSKRKPTLLLGQSRDAVAHGGGSR